jgi:pimeloyl-ACP methyl ester carboxylesterase
MPAIERFNVPSGDIEISVMKTGKGPALLLVHGAMLNATLSWWAALPKLSANFTVYAMDRRGRAPSGDAADYSISMEAGDLARVVAAIGEPVTLVSHSYGALITLEALDRLDGVAKLILYEPPFTVESRGPEAEDAMVRMESALEAGDREKVVAIFLCEQVGAPVEVLAAIRSSLAWPLILQIASTLPRESRAVNVVRDRTRQLAACTLPTTMLLGSRTRGHLLDGSLFVAKTIPGCKLVTLEGQGHTAMTEAPDLFAGKVIEAAL